MARRDSDPTIAIGAGASRFKTQRLRPKGRGHRERPQGRTRRKEEEREVQDRPAPARGGSVRQGLYEKQLKELHIELVKLQEWVKYKGLKIVLVFEGATERAREA
jgi:polyphosphate kinase 2 (PPK2 family)